ncbi:aminoglycoside adenylyltransferase domain-containing protein [Bacillus sp. 1P06AnD]|uniref:aminoglycoside adenylyltransferase domain-containing protein n=1 Tax=Bacillus sp. 1P06AnD TaxID=3132208 RepID=UPI0039A02B5A
MNAKLPDKVQCLLHMYIERMNVLIPDMVEGLYIHGSLALGAFVERSSDIDFITVIKRPLTNEELEKVADIHRWIAASYPSPEMDGVYMTKGDLEDVHSECQSLPYVSSGELYVGPYFNDNPVTWHVMEKYGIRVLGPETCGLNLRGKAGSLIPYVIANMNSYWTSRVGGLEAGKDSISLLSKEQIDVEIEWSVLGLLRQFYTIREDAVISKLGAGEYALNHVAEEWRPIIREAISIRLGKTDRVYRTERERVETMIDFMKYIMDQYLMIKKEEWR